MNEWYKAAAEARDDYERIKDEGVDLPTGETEYREPRYLYHTILHVPPPNESVDFFGRKSKATLERARIYRVTAEIQKMVSSDEVREWLTILNEYGYYENTGPLEDETREAIADRMRVFFLESGFEALGDFLAENDFHLFNIESQVSALITKEIDPIPLERLAQMERLRSTSYYLARTIEMRRRGCLVFDYKRLIQNGFRIYEANLQAVPGPLDGLEAMTNYMKTVKSVQIPSDCLVFRKCVETPYESSSGVEVSYDPYCPEYLVQPPSVEELEERMRGYSGSKKEFLQSLDPKMDYQKIVNILFNDALVDRE